MVKITALPVVNPFSVSWTQNHHTKKKKQLACWKRFRSTERRRESFGNGWRWEMQGSQLQPWQTGHVWALGQRTLAVFTGRRGTAEICWSRCWFMSQWVADNLEATRAWQPKLLPPHIRPTSLWCARMLLLSCLSGCAPQQSQQMPGGSSITLTVRGRAQTLTGVSKIDFRVRVNLWK